MPRWCLANKRDGSRCQGRMPPGTRNPTTQLLAELAELNIYANMQECLDKLVALTEIAVCHHQRYAVIEKLKSLLRAARLKSSSQGVPITPDSQNEGSRNSDRSESTPMKQESGANQARKKESRIQTSVTTSVIEVTYWLREPPSKALQYLSEYRPYDLLGLGPSNAMERVVEQAKKPLFIRNPKMTGGFQELDERWDGYIYVYWNRASFGLVKIGCTTVDVDRRLQQWEDKCQRLAEEHYRSPFRIKHVARVEKLIHTEFQEYRVFEPFCRGCGHKHIEWFRGLDLGLVIRRIEAWTEWITKEPYEEKLGSWRLKDRLELALPQICTAPDETNSPKKGNASGRRESPRYHLRHRRAQGSSQHTASSIRS